MEVNSEKQTRGAVSGIVEACLTLSAAPDSRSNYPAVPAGSCRIFDVESGSGLIEMSKLLRLHDELPPSALQSPRKVLRPWASLHGLHVGGGPLTYLSVRWKLRGIRLLRRHPGSKPSQIRKARRAITAARRKKRRALESREEGALLEVTLWRRKRRRRKRWRR